MTLAYFRKASSQNVRHAEIFFDPQTHTQRGIPIGTVIGGIREAQLTAERELHVTSKLILCFLRHLSEDDAMRTLDEALAAPAEPSTIRARALNANGVLSPERSPPTRSSSASAGR